MLYAYQKREILLRKTPAAGKGCYGFSLVEMALCIGILVVLIGFAAMFVSGGSESARRTVTDQVIGQIEQARSIALVSRSTVLLAIAEPGNLPMYADACAIGLLEVDGEWDPLQIGPVSCRLLGRWRPLEKGVIFLGGEMGTLRNVMDGPKVRIRYTAHRTVEADVHGIVFHARGRLAHPAGSAPAVIRLAEGGYPKGVPTPKRRAPDGEISAHWVKIGRVTGRAYEVIP